MRLKHDNSNPINSNSQHVFSNEQYSIPIHGPTTHNKNINVINIQLSYDPQAPTELELWSGNFHPIPLHGPIKHIILDTKNIKDFLNFITWYISNKQVDSVRLNNLEDLKDIGKAVWNFIFLVYQANWDSLHADNQSNLLRRKIMSKFTLKVILTPEKNKKETNKSVPANIERIPLPILAKFQKEVNVILKYFKSNKQAANPMQPAKSYAQVSKQNISTSEVIKIKEAFSSINAKKINQINNIVKSTPKTKPHIQMTTKGPSRKHVIIPMSNDNIIKFMKNLLTHIVNINRTLRNSKSEILVDFTCSNPLGIMVVTNKVFLQSDLQIIEHYVKNSNDINALQVEVPHLPQSKLYLKIIGIPFFLHGNFQD